MMAILYPLVSLNDFDINMVSSIDNIARPINIRMENTICILHFQWEDWIMNHASDEILRIPANYRSYLCSFDTALFFLLSKKKPNSTLCHFILKMGVNPF